MAGKCEQRLGSGIRLGVHGGVIQNRLALGNSQEACTLLIRLRSELGYFFYLAAGGECAVFLTVGDDVLRRGARETRNTLQKRGRCGVDINAHAVDAVLDNGVERLVEPLGRHIVLILPHADGLGVDFHKLRQRVLQSAGYRHGRAQVDIKLRELRRRKLACRVHRRSGLGNYHIGKLMPRLLFTADKLNGHLLGLTGGRAVADGDIHDIVLADQAGQRADSLLLFGIVKGRVHDGGVEHLAGCVDDGDLAAHAVARVETHGDLALDRRLHEQRTQVQRKLADSALGGGVGKLGANFTLERRENEPCVCVLAHGFYKLQ